MNAEETNNENFQNMHPAAPLEPVNTGLPTGASLTTTTTTQSSQPKSTDKKKPNVKQFEDDKTPQDKLLSTALDQEPASYKLYDFMSRPGFEKYSRHLTRVQDIVSKLGVKLRVPKIDRSFVPYVEVVAYDSLKPNFGVNYSYTATTAQPNPLAAANFADPTYNGPKAANVNNDEQDPNAWAAAYRNLRIAESNRNLEVKWSSDVTQVLLTAISTNRWDWLKNGTRQNRAAAQATVTDVTSLFTKDLDVAHGTIDTSLIAHWMYNFYSPDPDVAARPQITVININDLATFYNTSNTSIISNKATLLNLSTTSANYTALADNIIAKMIVLSPENNVIVNIGAPVANNAAYYGCPCRVIRCDELTKPIDHDVAVVLDQTLDEQTIEFSFFLNLFYLPRGLIFANGVTLTTYRADFQDALVRYHSRPEPSLGIFDNSTLPLDKVVWTYRVLKTMLIQLALKQYSAQTGVNVVDTAGRVLDDVLFNNQYLGMFAAFDPLVEVNHGTMDLNPVWIPYEFYNNNAQIGWSLTLDATNTTYGQRLAFANYKWPRSMVVDDDAIQYQNINDPFEAPDILVNRNNFTNCLPLTMRYWRSNNHISSIPPARYSHNKLLRVANTAWDETTYDNQVTEELTF